MSEPLSDGKASKAAAPAPYQFFRNRYVLVADVVAIAMAAWGAFALRFGWLFLPDRTEFPVFLAAAIAVKIVAFFVFGLYRRYWRYASIWDVMSVVVANSAASIVFGAVIVGIRLSGGVVSLSRSALPLDWMLATALTVGLRVSVRVMAEAVARQRTPVTREPRRVLIIGAGDAGLLVVREMAKAPQLGMRAVGFLDDEPSKWKKRIYGYPVLGPISALPEVLERHRVDEVVVAIPTAGGDKIRAIVDSCRAEGVSSRVMPGMGELLDKQFTVSRLREVDIADLLRRPQVGARAEVLANLADNTVIVTGAGGSIGSELCRQVALSRPKQLILLGHGENSIFQIAAELKLRFPQLPVQAVIADIRDRERVLRIFRAASPNVVFHAAAHKHVHLMEENVCEAITNNVVGTRNVVDAALSSGVQRFVLVSTDKAVAPSSVMGASKRIAEAIVRDAAKRRGRGFVVVRFGNVLGSRGSVVPIFKEQIERGGPVTVTHPDVRRFFMTIPEAVHLILQAAGLGRGGELFVLDMGQPVRLRDLAEDMIRLSGLRPEGVSIVYTGLRQGEKLEEFLWEEGSQWAPTLQPDIRVVDEPEAVSPDRLGGVVDALIDAALRDDPNRVVKLLSESIPTAGLTALPDPWDSGRAPRIVGL